MPLTQAGLPITAVELLPSARKILMERGVEDVRVGGIETLGASDRFDTVLLLMNGLGLAGTLDRLGSFLADLSALLAPGGQQMRVCLEAGSYTIKMGTAEKVSGHCPSVDVLMRSVAEQAGPRGIGIMLTGMGRDGAEGMLAMRKRGARTIAQDAASSVVFGMPREAFRRGAVQRLLPLGEIAREIGLIVEKQA